MLNAIAIDDEPDALEVVKIHASKVPFLTLEQTFTNAIEAIDYLQKNQVDLLFLDIEMPDISGIEFMKSLQKSPMLIFTTAYLEYGVQGFELDAIDYLLKPFSLARFLKACHKALEYKNLHSTEQEGYIFLKSGYEEEKVLISEILFIEADGNYLTFFLSDRKVLTRQTMADVLIMLPHKKFSRVHRSFIIAIDKIEKITRNDVLIAGKEIPFGASYDEEVKEMRKRI